MKIVMVYVVFLELEHKTGLLLDSVCKYRAGEVQLLMCTLRHLLWISTTWHCSGNKLGQWTVMRQPIYCECQKVKWV